MKKLIITDDLKPIIESGRNILTRKNIAILTVSSGEDVLKIHEEENSDLIIMRLKMPGMGGDEICTSIRNNGSLKKVSIILVCDNDRADIAKCQACSANAFITKPVDSKEVFRNIRKFLYVSDRKNTRIIFQVFIKGKAKDRFFFANTENISNSGILLETDEVIKKGERISCSFFIEKDLVTLNGKVMRIVEEDDNMHHYGIQFINLNLTSLKKIEAFIYKS